MKKSLLLVCSLLLSAPAFSRDIQPATDRAAEPTMAFCKITRVSLATAKTLQQKVQAPLTFISEKPNTGKANVVFNSDLMPSLEIRFEISFAGKIDSTRMMTVEKSTGKAVSQYISNNILMNFVSGSGVAYNVQPNNSFLSADGKFVFDIACGESIY